MKNLDLKEVLCRCDELWYWLADNPGVVYGLWKHCLDHNSSYACWQRHPHEISYRSLYAKEIADFCVETSKFLSEKEESGNVWH